MYLLHLYVWNKLNQMNQKVPQELEVSEIFFAQSEMAIWKN